MPDQPKPVLGPRFVKAVRFAVELHGEQPRKGSQIPYLTHLFAVCGLVLEDGGTEDEAIAALLHDGPEDRGGAPVLAMIRRRFGKEVAEIVEGLSDSLTATDEEKEPWHPRKERYLKRLDAESKSVLRVSLADKLHNGRSIETDLADPSVGAGVWERFNVGIEDQEWYYQNLLAIFERRFTRSRNLPAFREIVLSFFPVTSKVQLDSEFRARLRRGVRSVPSSSDPRGTYSVYVALLHNVAKDPGEYSLYVGSTGKTPEVRYIEHLNGYKDGKGWIGESGAGLLARVPRRLNPMRSSNEAEASETALIAALRAEGFTVHGK